MSESGLILLAYALLLVLGFAALIAVLEVLSGGLLT